MPQRGSNDNSEQVSFDKNGVPSLLAVDSTTTNKTTKIMTEVHNDKNHILTSTILTLSDGTPVDASNPIPVDTEISLSGDVIVEKVKIEDISAGTQTNDVKITLDSEVVSIADSKATTAGTSTGISVGSTSTTILDSNANRKKAIIVNDSNETIYLKYGSGAESNKGIRLNEYGGSLEETVYTGIITGICASGSKIVTVTEL